MGCLFARLYVIRRKKLGSRNLNPIANFMIFQSL